MSHLLCDGYDFVAAFAGLADFGCPLSKSVATGHSTLDPKAGRDIRYPSVSLLSRITLVEMDRLPGFASLAADPE